MDGDLKEMLNTEEQLVSAHAQERSAIKQARINDSLFLPIIALLTLVPLIVRMEIIRVSEEVDLIYKKAEIAEFYSQGKAMSIIFITIMMGIIMGFCYQKQHLKRFKDLAVYIIAGGVFLIFTVLSTVFSKYPGVAVWGVPERAEGLVIMGCYIIIAFYTLYAVKETEQYRYIMFALGVLVIISTVIGVSQYLGNDLLTTELGRKIIIPNKFAAFRGSLQAQFPSRIMTLTMYNPNYVGSFAALMFPLFAIPLCFKTGIRVKIVTALLSICCIILLIGSNSRGGLIGVTASIILAVVIFAKRIVKAKKLMFGGLIILMLLFIAEHIITQGLLLDRITFLVSDMTKLVRPVATNYDYRDSLRVRDVQTTKDQAVIILQEHSVVVKKQGEEFVFYDENNQSIAYYLEGDTYTSQDERFEGINFLCLYTNNEQEALGGFGLLVDGMFTFVFQATDQGEIYMIDSYTQQRVEVVDVPAIGFKGRESIGSGRGYIWSRSIPMLKETLLIGSGPDTYIMWFPQGEYFVKWYALMNPFIIVDKPHNMYLQIGINQGVIALVAFLTLVGAYIIDSMRLYALKQKYKKEVMAGTSILLAIVGYLVAAIFNDSSISVAPLFWVLLGAGIAFNYLVKHNKNQEIEGIKEIEGIEEVEGIKEIKEIKEM